MSKWISITDRVPEDKHRVLVCFINDAHREVWHEDNSCCQVATYRNWHNPVFVLDCECVGGYINLNIDKSAVQYWMPLPEPPEQS